MLCMAWSNGGRDDAQALPDVMEAKMNTNLSIMEINDDLKTFLSLLML